MKTSPLDFILSGLLICVLLTLAILLTATASLNITRPFFGAYYIIIDPLILLLFYGLLSAIFIRMAFAVRPLPEGYCSMDSGLFTYWKLVTVTYEFGRGALLPFTTVFARPLVAKMFGARIGNDIALGGRLVDPELIRIGNEAIIGQDSVITAHAITSGAIILKEVIVGDRATVGVNVVVMPGVEIGEDAVVAAGAVVAPNTLIPANELWGGIPAKKIKDIDTSDIRG